MTSVDAAGRAATAVLPSSAPRTAASPTRRMRGEVQGLRAVAVALVVVYHLHPSALPGGYVGVDVFFVISGFLITRHLAAEARRTGRIDLAAFWAGRVRRILPAALVTTAAVTVAAVVLLPRTAAAEVGRAAAFSAVSAANWWFAAQSVDYQAQSPDASPFEHFWSLGVEEQFYLLWPLALLAAALVARRLHRDPRRALLVPVVLVLAASLAFGIAFTASGSEAAYFITPTRMWELAAGGLLAVLLGERALPALSAGILQSAGLAAVGAGAVLFDADTPMPGVAAVLPVAGAVAVIAGGDVPGLRRLWALRPVRALGDASYSLYLWHWPLIVLARQLTGHAPGRLQTAALLTASLLAAAASYRVVEQPLRRLRIRRPLRVVATGLVAVVAVAAVALVPVVRLGVVEHQEAAERRAVEQQGGAPLGWPQLDAAADRTWVRPQHVTTPSPEDAGKDIPFPECTTDNLDPRTPVCVRGDPTSPVTVALVGDSHAEMWSGEMDRLAQQEHWRLITLVHNSCPFSLLPREMERSGHSNCTTAVRYGMGVLRAQHVRAVITTEWRKDYPGQVHDAAEGYSSLWRTLQQEGVPVVALGDTPAPPSADGRTIPDCVAAHDPATCGVDRSVAESRPDPLLVAAAETPGVAALNPVDAFCGTTRCPGVIGNVLVYRDLDHITDTYARTTQPWLVQHLVPLVRHAIGSAAA